MRILYGMLNYKVVASPFVILENVPKATKTKLHKTLQICSQLAKQHYSSGSSFLRNIFWYLHFTVLLLMFFCCSPMFLLHFNDTYIICICILRRQELYVVCLVCLGAGSVQLLIYTYSVPF